MGQFNLVDSLYNMFGVGNVTRLPSRIFIKYAVHKCLYGIHLQLVRRGLGRVGVQAVGIHPVCESLKLLPLSLFYVIEFGPQDRLGGWVRLPKPLLKGSHKGIVVQGHYLR